MQPNKATQPTTERERTQGATLSALSFCAYSPKGKRKQQEQPTKREKGQAEDNRSREDEGKAKSIKGEQTQGQKKKNGGKHATSL